MSPRVLFDALMKQSENSLSDTEADALAVDVKRMQPIEEDPSHKDLLSAELEIPQIPLKERANREEDEYWKRINTESGAAAWQKAHGVQWRISRGLKGKIKSVLTASNVRQEDLVMQYSWQFIDITNMGPMTPLGGRFIAPNPSFEEVHKYAENILTTVPNHTLLIPDTWPNITDANILINEVHLMIRAMLRIQIEKMEKQLGSEVISITTIKESDSVPSSEADSLRAETITLGLWDNPTPSKDLRGQPLDAAFNALYVLLWPGNYSAASELAVERVVGALVAPNFEVSECETLSGQSVRTSLILGCFGSYASADVCTKMIFHPPTEVSNLKASPPIDLTALQPVVFGADAKIRLRDIISKGRKASLIDDKDIPNDDSAEPTSGRGTCASMHRVSAQLAFLFQPTLKIFIAHLSELAEMEVTRNLESTIQDWESISHEEKLKLKVQAVEWKKLTIPEWMFVYGVGYDSDGFIVYTFYPVLFVDRNRPRWEFHCYQMSTRYERVFVHYDALQRIGALKTLVAMRRHSHFLAQYLSAGDHRLRFPAEFILVVKNMAKEDEAIRRSQAEAAKQREREKRSQRNAESSTESSIPTTSKARQRKAPKQQEEEKDYRPNASSGSLQGSTRVTRSDGKGKGKAA